VDFREGKLPPGEFQNVANRIAREIVERSNAKEGISPKDLPEIVARATNKEINCYPGYPCNACYPEAFFISITNPRHTKGYRGHLSCRQALEKLVQHMQGWCTGKSREAIMITDNWNADAFEEWRANIEQIRHNSLVEIYFLTPVGTSVRIF